MASVLKRSCNLVSAQYQQILSRVLFNKISKVMEQEINFRILETIEACKSIHSLEEKEENHISIKELLTLEDIYG